ncbi:MAG: hypothetical protein NWE84_03120 [Candidatus Bathyarchaeota archaeon]|nr:hypothetical protein [Candidatus Bathyarchaeota archaeon]
MKSYRLARSSSMRLMAIVVALALIALISIFFIPSLAAASETPSVEWRQTYNGLQVLSVIQTADEGYAIAGASESPDAATFVKTDSAGKVQWQKAQGDVVSVVQTRDLGYVLFYADHVVKTNADGDFELTFPVGLFGTQEGIVTSDGDYVLVGNSLRDNGEPFAWLKKFDEQGNLLWNNTYTGGVSLYAVTETADRGCAVAGNLKNDFWLAKIDSNSNRQWSQIYSYGDIQDMHVVYSLVQTKDGGFVLAGTGDWQASGGLIPWLIKVDSQGFEERYFSLPYGQIPNDNFRVVVQTDDEGYTLALGNSAKLLRTDSSGSELWTLTLDDGSWGSNYQSSCLIRTIDGGYITAGTVFGNTAVVTKISPEPDTQPPEITVSSPESKTYETSEVPLMVAVNEPVSWIAYRLDGQPEVTITGNTTLSGLAIGAHNITVSAQDLWGMMSSSTTIHFTIVPRFPIELVAISVTIATFFVLSFVAYVKRHSLSAYRKKGLAIFFQKQRLTALGKNRMIWTLTIISLSILLVFAQVFFPYVYYSVSSGSASSTFEVGVSYVYEQDGVKQIYDQVSRIKELGFSVIRVNMVCDSINPNSFTNTLTEYFFSAVRQLGIKVTLIINNHERVNNINYYLARWGNDLTYVQILNEPDVASSWDIGALFSDDEAGSKFEEVYALVEQHQLSAQYYTNFGIAFPARTNLPILFSEKLDFIGFDVFMESFLALSPKMVQLLQKITKKEIVISEFGMSTSDDTKQADYLIRGLNLFKRMGLRGCWIVYWNSVDNVYGIRGRLAEQKVGEWIAQNT